MKDAVLNEFIERHKNRLRRESVLEKLRNGSNYFALEWTSAEGMPPRYMIRRDAPVNGGYSDFPVDALDLGAILRGPKPFIPALLRRLKHTNWAVEADALTTSDEPSFLYDGMTLPHERLALQFDWAYASVPDGFKLGVKFHGEPTPNHYYIHNDVVATAVENGQSALKLALQICPEVLKKLFEFEPDLRAAWQQAVLNDVTPTPISPPVAVPGHALRL